MSIRLDPTPVGKNKAAIPNLIAGLTGFAADDFFKSAVALFEAHKAWRTPKSTLEQKAWSLYCDAMIRGLHEFLRTTPLPDHRNTDQIKDFVQSHLHTCADRGTSDKITLLFSHKQKPTDIPLYALLRDAIPAFIEHYAPEHGHEDRHLQIWLDTAFKHGFVQACYADPEAFQELHDALDKSGPTGERAEIWQKYYDFLSRQIDEDPIFGQPEGGLTLKDVFVDLRCFWTERIKSNDQSIHGDSTPRAKKRIHHIHWLNNELRDWARRDDKNDTLRIVTGGPGSGKSSSALILARDLARSGLFNTYIVRLQGLDLSKDMAGIISEFQMIRADEPKPLEWLHIEDKPLILVFDGLDEIAPPDTALAEATTDFLEKLSTELDARNERSLKVKAIALGRPEATETAAKQLRLRARPLLHILPLCVLTSKPEAFVMDYESPTDQSDEGYNDQTNAMQIEQRIEFWNKAHKAGGFEATKPEVMLHPNLEDLTREPLLFYLLILSGLPLEQWQETSTNRNRLYKDIFTKIHERDWQKKGSVSRGLGSDSEESAANFFTLMECLGLASWRNGGRTGKNRDFAELRGSYATESQSEKFNNIRASNLDYLALQFFIRPCESEKGEFGFVHKSFGEYLTARALINAGHRWVIKSEELTPRKIAKNWLLLTSQQAVTRSIRNFMHYEAALALKTKDVEDCGLQAIEYTKAYTDILSHIIQEGLPAHETVLSGTWREREQKQRNAEEAFFAVLQTWASLAYPFDRNKIPNPRNAGKIKIAWPNDTSAIQFFKRLYKQRFTNRERPLLPFSNLYLSRQILFATDLSFFVFSMSDLSGANLGQAILYRAHLYGANLEGAILFEANLRRANLERTNLKRADLTRADLTRADLTKAKIGLAKCAGANFTDSLLRSADLSEATHLTQEQINAAHGNSHTKLPPDLHHPDHWDKD